MDEGVLNLFIAAAAGEQAPVQPGAISQALVQLAAAQDAQQQAAAAQNARLLLHAAEHGRQLERALLEVQSATALYPATTPLLLQALSSPHRQQLAGSVAQWCSPEAAAQQQQLAQLCACDVLLLLSLWSDQRWEQAAGLVLLQGVQDSPSTDGLRQLFTSLASLTGGAAAEWLVGVGLAWATTCFLDLPVDSAVFEAAGLQLLQAGLLATPALAAAGLPQLLQKLMREGSSSPLWKALQLVVADCSSTIQQQQQQQQQQQHICSGGWGGSATLCCSSSNSQCVVADACQQQLLGGLVTLLLQQQQPLDLALRYVRAISPLAGATCIAAAAMLQAAAAHLEQQQGQARGHAGQLWGIKSEQQLDIKLEEAAADVADLAGLAAVQQRGGAGAAGPPGSSSGWRRTPRYSWGSGRNGARVGNSSAGGGGRGLTPPTSRPAPSAAAAAPATAQAAGQQGALPLLSPVSAGGAAGSGASQLLTGTLVGGGLTPFHGLHIASQLPAGSALEAANLEPPAPAGSATPAAAGSQQTPAARASGSCLQQQRQSDCCDLATRNQELLQLLARAAAPTLQQQQQQRNKLVEHPGACHLSPRQQVALALASAVLRQAQPCLGSEPGCSCSQQLVSGLLRVMRQLPAAALEVLAAVSDQQQEAGAVHVGSSSRSSSGWRMAGCWQQAVMQLLQAQLLEASSSSSSSSSSSGAVLGLLLKAWLRGLQQEAPHIAAGCWQQLLAAPEAALLSQLLQYLQQQQQQCQQLPGAGDGGELQEAVAQHPAAAARVAQLLAQQHVLSLLLGWLLQHPGAVQQLCDGTAAGAAPTPQQQQQQELEEQQQQQQLLPHNPSGSSSGDTTAHPALKLLQQLGLQLHQLQAVELPAALRQLLIKTQHAAAEQQQAAAAAAAAAVGTLAGGGGASQGNQAAAGTDNTTDGAAHDAATANGKKRKRTTVGFYIVRGTDSHATAAAAAGGAAAAAGATPPAAAQPAAAPEAGAADGPELLPAGLLQLQVLPPAACAPLLAAVCSELCGVASVLQQQQSEQQQQQQQQQHPAEQQARRSCRNSDNVRRQFSSAAKRGRAAGAAGGTLASTPAGAAASTAGNAADGGEACGTEAEPGPGLCTPAVDSAALAAGGPALPAGAAAVQQRELQLAGSMQQLQRGLLLADLAVASALLWAGAACSSIGGPAAAATAVEPAGVQGSDQATAGCLQCAVQLLQLHQALSCPVLAASAAAWEAAAHGRVAPGSLQHQAVAAPTAVPDTERQQEVLLARVVCRQQLSGLAPAALSAAARLLEAWWTAAAAAAAQTGPDGAAGGPDSATAEPGLHRLLEQLQTPLQELRMTLQLQRRQKQRQRQLPQHSNGGDVGVSYQDWKAVFGDVGAASWQGVKRLEQQHELLGLLLALAVQVHYAVEDCAAAAAASKPKTSAAAAGRGSHNSSSSSLAQVVSALLQHLALLRAIAGAVFEPGAVPASGGYAGAAPAAGGCFSAVWLLRQVDGWLLELALGNVLHACHVTSPEAAIALLQLTRLCRVSSKHATRVLTSSQHSVTSSIALPIAAHQLALYHSPRVYAAGQQGLWGRRGLGAGPAAAPDWLVGCSRAVAVAAARAALQLLLQQGGINSSSSSCQAQGSWPDDTAAAAAAGPDAVAGRAGALAAQADAGRFWRGQAMCVAAACSCCELLLHQLRLPLPRRQQHEQQGPEEAGGCSKPPHPAPVAAAAAGNAAGGSTAGALCDGHDLLLLVQAVSACLAGPCMSAAVQLSAWLTQQQQQQQQQQRQQQQQEEEGPAAAAAAEEAAAGEAGGSGGAAAAAAGGHVAAAGTRGKGRARRQPRSAADTVAAAAAKQQKQLCLLVGLGCAAAQLAVRICSSSPGPPAAGAAAAADGAGSSKSRMLRQLQQLPAGAATVSRLLLHLRQFSAASQQLTRQIEAAAAAAGAGQGDAASPPAGNAAVAADGDGISSPSRQHAAAARVAADLECSMAAAAGQRRRDALAAAAAAAAAAVTEDDDQDEHRTNSSSPGGGGGGEARPWGAAGDSAAAAAGVLELAGTVADCWRFTDPEVREELPGGVCLSDDEDPADTCEAGAAGEQQPGRSGAAVGGDAAGAQLDAQQQRQRQELFGGGGGEPPAAGGDASGKEGGAATASQQTTPQQQTPAAAEAEAGGSRATAASEQPAQEQQQGPALAKRSGRQNQMQRPRATGSPADAGTAAAALAAARAVAAARKGASPVAAPPPAAAAVAVVAAATPGPSSGCRGPRSQQKQQQKQQNQLQQQEQHSATVPVLCGSSRAEFDPVALVVVLPGGRVVTPTAFEQLSGRGRSKRWRTSIRVAQPDGSAGRTMLAWLQEQEQQGRQQHEEQQAAPAAGAGGGVRPAKRRRSAEGGVPAAAAAAAAGQRAEDAAAHSRDQSQRGVQAPQRAGPAAGKRLQPERVAPASRSGAGAAAAGAGARKQPRHRQQQQQQQQEQQRTQPRNAYVLACLSEQQRRRNEAGAVAAAAGAAAASASAAGSGSSDGGSQQQRRRRGRRGESDSEPDESDYSDLEDFIVCERGTDYEKLCAQVGRRVSWKRGWQGGRAVSGGVAGARGEQDSEDDED